MPELSRCLWPSMQRKLQRAAADIAYLRVINSVLGCVSSIGWLCPCDSRTLRGVFCSKSLLMYVIMIKHMHYIILAMFVFLTECVYRCNYARDRVHEICQEIVTGV